MSKRQGELTELIFYKIAYEKGFIISKPFGDNTSYDFILDTGKRLLRVQVKSVSVLDTSSRANRYHILATHGRDCKKSYTEKEIDILAAYVIPCKAWYLIPIEKVQAKTSLSLFPHRIKNHGLYEQYLNNWNL